MPHLPLDEAWRSAIARVLAAHGWPSLEHPARLGPLVARLSESYNLSGTAAAELLPARLAFSFPRDVPKAAAAVRELVLSKLLALPAGRPLRVLDIGAGLGATTWGVARALEASGERGDVDATWMDTDGRALELGQELARAFSEHGEPPVRLRIRVARGERPPAEPFDLVLLGQVLSELDVDMIGKKDAEREERHAERLRLLLAANVAPNGSLVVVEPALRDRTRHLHAVRDRVLAFPDVHVFAPCLHRGACPARASEGDWCHEDLPVDLPEWLVPVARAAGLRWQGLTFSYLVLRRDGASLASRGFPLRVISGAIVTKGKREHFLCAPPPESTGGAPLRLRVQRLDRHESEANAVWSNLTRGDRVRIEPPPSPPLGRVIRETRVDVDAANAY